MRDKTRGKSIVRLLFLFSRLSPCLWTVSFTLFTALKQFNTQNGYTIDKQEKLFSHVLQLFNRFNYIEQYTRIIIRPLVQLFSCSLARCVVVSWCFLFFFIMFLPDVCWLASCLVCKFFVRFCHCVIVFGFFVRVYIEIFACNYFAQLVDSCSGSQCTQMDRLKERQRTCR